MSNTFMSVVSPRVLHQPVSLDTHTASFLVSSRSPLFRKVRFWSSVKGSEVSVRLEGGRPRYSRGQRRVSYRRSPRTWDRRGGRPTSSSTVVTQGGRRCTCRGTPTSQRRSLRRESPFLTLTFPCPRWSLPTRVEGSDSKDSTRLCPVVGNRQCPVGRGYCW